MSIKMASLLQNLQEIQLKALDAAGSAIMITDMLDPEHPIIYCHEEFVNATGYPRTEIHS